jgi:hypothetical protein
MRTSGLGFSLLLIAAGAVLAWAVEVDAEGVNLNTVGLILFAVGIVGALATMVLTGVDRTTVIERDRNHVVERET